MEFRRDIPTRDKRPARLKTPRFNVYIFLYLFQVSLLARLRVFVNKTRLDASTDGNELRL